MTRLLFSVLFLAAIGTAQPLPGRAFRVAELPPADLNGTWKAKADGPQGAMERTFVFKVDGTKLTGETTSTMLGKSTIADGKVDGDNFSFTITADLQGTQMKLTYKGKFTADQFKLTSEIEGGDGSQVFQWIGTKVK